MHVLVTGGAGFIGSHSVDALLAVGAQVTVLDNLSTGKLTNLPKSTRLHFIQGDIRDARTVEQALQGVSHVLHLAAQVSVTASITDPVISFTHNIQGFLNVLDGVRRHKIMHMVYASSAAVYGTPIKLPLDESAPMAPLSPYALEKSINDQYASLYHELYGVDAIGLRYFNVYGPRQDSASAYAGVISRFASAILKGDVLTVFGDGEQTRDFVFVKDVALLNVRALQSDAVGVCNIATGSSITLMELIQILGSCSGSVPQVVHSPSVNGDILHSATNTGQMRSWFGAMEMTPIKAGLQQLMASHG
jgi:UDP-glucose 4-epimerase